MPKVIRVRYEGGVLKPLDKVELRERSSSSRLWVRI